MENRKKRRSEYNKKWNSAKRAVSEFNKKSHRPLLDTDSDDDYALAEPIETTTVANEATQSTSQIVSESESEETILNTELDSEDDIHCGFQAVDSSIISSESESDSDESHFTEDLIHLINH